MTVASPHSRTRGRAWLVESEPVLCHAPKERRHLARSDAAMNHRSLGLAAFSMLAFIAALGTFSCLALPADADRRNVATVVHAASGFNVSLGRQTHGGQQAFKGLDVPLRRPSATPSAPADLPIFVNPLKRKHMALLPGLPRPAIETAERL